MNIFILDSDPWFRRSIQHQLGRVPGCNIAGGADCASEAFASARCRTADVLIVDLGLTDADGIAVVRRLREVNGSAKIFVLSGRPSERAATAARAAGAFAYVHKSTPPTALLQAIVALRRGERFVAA